MQTEQKLCRIQLVMQSALQHVLIATQNITLLMTKIAGFQNSVSLSITRVWIRIVQQWASQILRVGLIKDPVCVISKAGQKIKNNRTQMIVLRLCWGCMEFYNF